MQSLNPASSQYIVFFYLHMYVFILYNTRSYIYIYMLHTTYIASLEIIPKSRDRQFHERYSTRISDECQTHMERGCTRGIETWTVMIISLGSK